MVTCPSFLEASGSITHADSPGEARIRCLPPPSLSLSLSSPLISDKADINLSRLLACARVRAVFLLLLFLLSSSSSSPLPPPRRGASRVAKFLSSLESWSNPRALPPAANVRPALSHGIAAEKEKEEEKKENGEATEPNRCNRMCHTRAQPLPLPIAPDLFPAAAANFCPCHVETCFGPTRRLLSPFLSRSLLSMIEETSLSLCSSYTRVSPVVR